MQPPRKPINEAERLHALKALQILDTSNEERFDRITRMAAQMFDVPIALVSLVDADRQWFKSTQGLDITELPREFSFCGHTINQDNVYVVPDTLDDIRFFDNPLVVGAPYVRFYAGYSLKLRPGINLGTLCIVDMKPRVFSKEDKQLLRDFGAMIEQEIKSIQWATFDDLTEVSSRRGFFSLAEHAKKLCMRKHLPMALILFDLDKFKLINDLYGHHEGDFALIKFAETMRKTFRDSDIIGRLGGDEFIVMFLDTDKAEIELLLTRFQVAINTMNTFLNKPYKIEFSAGVCFFASDMIKPLDEMIEDTDTAMYRQKYLRQHQQV